MGTTRSFLTGFDKMAKKKTLMGLYKSHKTSKLFPLKKMMSRAALGLGAAAYGANKLTDKYER